MGTWSAAGEPGPKRAQLRVCVRHSAAGEREGALGIASLLLAGIFVRSLRESRYHGRMDDFEKKWRRIQEQLRLQMNGDERPRLSSGRTLFGIQSEGERKMDEFARQIEEEYQTREQGKEKGKREL